MVGLCLNPPENAIVLCADEKSQIQALNRTAPILPVPTHDHQRNDTLFTVPAVVNVEVFFESITRQAIRRGSFDSVTELVTAIRTFIAAGNDRCHRRHLDHHSRRDPAPRHP